MQDNNFKFDSQKEKEDSKMIFQGMLVFFLEDHQNPFLKDYNLELIEYLSEDESFKKKLEYSLLNNQEALTADSIVIKGVVVVPTISNWLKDFIDNCGSGLFDAVILSQYLANSANAKKLNDVEKKLLRKLLILYRNLKFFPKSLENVSLEKWGIIPSEHRPEDDKIAKTEKSEDPKIKELTILADSFPKGSLERRAVEEEMGKLGHE